MLQPVATFLCSQTVPLPKPFAEKLAEVLSERIAASDQSIREFGKEHAWEYSHISKVLSGKLEPGPVVVGRVLALVTPETAERILRDYLAHRRLEVEELAQHFRKRK